VGIDSWAINRAQWPVKKSPLHGPTIRTASGLPPTAGRGARGRGDVLTPGEPFASPPSQRELLEHRTRSSGEGWRTPALQVRLRACGSDGSALQHGGPPKAGQPRVYELVPSSTNWVVQDRVRSTGTARGQKRSSASSAFGWWIFSRAIPPVRPGRKGISLGPWIPGGGGVRISTSAVAVRLAPVGGLPGLRAVSSPTRPHRGSTRRPGALSYTSSSVCAKRPSTSAGGATGASSATGAPRRAGSVLGGPAHPRRPARPRRPGRILGERASSDYSRVLGPAPHVSVRRPLAHHRPPAFVLDERFGPRPAATRPSGAANAGPPGAKRSALRRPSSAPEKGNTYSDSPTSSGTSFEGFGGRAFGWARIGSNREQHGPSRPPIVDRPATQTTAIGSPILARISRPRVAGLDDIFRGGWGIVRLWLGQF